MTEQLCYPQPHERHPTCDRSGHLTAEQIVRDYRTAPGDDIHAAAERLLDEVELHRATSGYGDDSLLSFENDILAVARFALAAAPGAQGGGE